MKISYDPSADAMYIHLLRGKINDTVEIGSNFQFFVDLDKEGNILGLEILAASRYLANKKGKRAIELGNKTYPLPALVR